MLKVFFFDFFKSFRCVFIPQSCLQLIQNIFQKHLIFEKILKFLKKFFFLKKTFFFQNYIFFNSIFFLSFYLAEHKFSSSKKTILKQEAIIRELRKQLKSTQNENIHLEIEMHKNKNQASNKFQKRKHISGQDKRDEFGKKKKTQAP